MVINYQAAKPLISFIFQLYLNNIKQILEIVFNSERCVRISILNFNTLFRNNFKTIVL